MNGVKSMERCPSCNALVNTEQKFCNECGCNLLEAKTNANTELKQARSYKLRSPILESSILYDDEQPSKKYEYLLGLSYGFWLLSLAFFVCGAIFVYRNYAVDLFETIKQALFLFGLALFSFILPGIIAIIVNVEENLSLLAREAKKDKND